VVPDESTFLGSRDIAIGVHSLVVGDDPERQRDVALSDQGCEAVGASGARADRKN
jgi:hypothetical protein